MVVINALSNPQSRQFQGAYSLFSFCFNLCSLETAQLQANPLISLTPSPTPTLLLTVAMTRLKSIVLASVHVLVSSAHVTTGRDGHGLIGYGISMYNPLCAYTCRDVLSTSMLACSEHTDMHMPMLKKREMHMDIETSPECYASDDSFLRTLAYCMSTHCSDVAMWSLEKYWNLNVAGRQPNQPVPKTTYQQTLANIATKPSVELVLGEDLNQTMLVSDDDYQASYNAQAMFEKMEDNHEKYAYVLPR